MKMTMIILALGMSLSALAFEPVYVETEKFTNKVSRQFQEGNHPRLCKFETRFNEQKNVIEIRVGVVGSPVDYFGWDMPLRPYDFPLEAGLKKYYKVPGVTGMLLTYDGKTLKFDLAKGEQVWNRIYSFSLEIDSELKHPGKFKGVLKGFERSFGRLKKHVEQTCQF